MTVGAKLPKALAAALRIVANGLGPAAKLLPADAQQDLGATLEVSPPLEVTPTENPVPLPQVVDRDRVELSGLAAAHRDQHHSAAQDRVKR
jgi:hypothetical protein